MSPLKLLNFADINNNNLRLYTEEEFTANVGDYIYISGGYYDNYNSLFDKINNPLTHNSFIFKNLKGYKVLEVGNSSGSGSYSFTIDYPITNSNNLVYPYGSETNKLGLIDGTLPAAFRDFSSNTGHRLIYVFSSSILNGYVSNSTISNNVIGSNTFTGTSNPNHKTICNATQLLNKGTVLNASLYNGSFILAGVPVNKSVLEIDEVVNNVGKFNYGSTVFKDIYSYNCEYIDGNHFNILNSNLYNNFQNSIISYIVINGSIIGSPYGVNNSEYKSYIFNTACNINDSTIYSAELNKLSGNITLNNCEVYNHVNVPIHEFDVALITDPINVNKLYLTCDYSDNQDGFKHLLYTQKNFDNFKLNGLLYRPNSYSHDTNRVKRHCQDFDIIYNNDNSIELNIAIDQTNKTCIISMSFDNPILIPAFETYTHGIGYTYLAQFGLYLMQDKINNINIYDSNLYASNINGSFIRNNTGKNIYACLLNRNTIMSTSNITTVLEGLINYMYNCSIWFDNISYINSIINAYIYTDEETINHKHLCLNSDIIDCWVNSDPTHTSHSTEPFNIHIINSEIKNSIIEKTTISYSTIKNETKAIDCRWSHCSIQSTPISTISTNVTIISDLDPLNDEILYGTYISAPVPKIVQPPSEGIETEINKRISTLPYTEIAYNTVDIDDVTVEKTDISVKNINPNTVTSLSVNETYNMAVNNDGIPVGQTEFDVPNNFCLIPSNVIVNTYVDRPNEVSLPDPLYNISGYRTLIHSDLNLDMSPTSTSPYYIKYSKFLNNITPVANHLRLIGNNPPAVLPSPTRLESYGVDSDFVIDDTSIKLPSINNKKYFGHNTYFVSNNNKISRMSSTNFINIKQMPSITNLIHEITFNSTTYSETMTSLDINTNAPFNIPQNTHEIIIEFDMTSFVGTLPSGAIFAPFTIFEIENIIISQDRTSGTLHNVRECSSYDEITGNKHYAPTLAITHSGGININKFLKLNMYDLSTTFNLVNGVNNYIYFDLWVTPQYLTNKSTGNKPSFYDPSNTYNSEEYIHSYGGHSVKYRFYVCVNPSISSGYLLSESGDEIITDNSENIEIVI